jgi:Concanavalin A-like lectin/glucanases superfamily
MVAANVWPKPPRWQAAPGLANPAQRWLWHSRPRFILPLWEPAAAGTAQRYQRIGRGGRVWGLFNGAAAARTRYGPVVNIPTTNGAEIETLGADLSFSSNESYTFAFLLRMATAGGTQHIWRSGTSSTGDHILWIATATPNYRHSGSGTAQIAGSALTAGAWHTVVQTWRPGQMALYQDGLLVNSSTAAAAATSDAFVVRRFGWGFSTFQDFHGDIALIVCCASAWTPAMVARWHADPFGFLRPWEHPSLISSASPPLPPSTGTGVVVCIMA